MSPGRTPTEEEAQQAVSLLLSALEGGGDIFDALEEIRLLHPRDNTFPGEVFMRVAADALAEGRVSPENTISQERLVQSYLPECAFKGRNNQKIRYALLVGAATHAGVEVDLLDEVIYWGTDDFWSYAALAAIAWIRAVAQQRDVPLTEMCSRLRTRTRSA
jgi:hypothetical protein